MRLISQDGGMDLPYENIILESMDDCKCIFAHTGTGQPYRMAEYSSVEKMNKVMDMVRNKYGEKRLFTYLRDNGYLIRRKGTDYNAPTQRSMEMGLFEVKETAITHSDGHTTVNKTTKVTGKGQQYFINKFLADKEVAV